MSIEELYPGREASRQMTANLEIIRAIAEVSGDHNPIHFSDAAARAAGFQGVIAHALFCEGLISAVIAGDLPGPGSIILSQEICCLKPVYLGDTVTATITIRHIDMSKGFVDAEILCVNQVAVPVMKGTVRLLLRE